MLRTIEMRWFFTQQPLDLNTFCSPLTETQERTDWYIIPANPDCGIKVREGRLETKLRAATYGAREIGKFAGLLESWKKWSLDFPSGEQPPSMEEMAGTGWLDVDKKRYLQRFEVRDGIVEQVDTRPVNGCEFEITELCVQNQQHWTVGFEALGDVFALESNLQSVAETIAARGKSDLAFQLENSFGYAKWLGQFDTSKF